MTVAINGIAHVYLTVNDFERAVPFYRGLLALFDMTCLVDTDELYYCVGARTGVGVRRAHSPETFDQYRAGPLRHAAGGQPRAGQGASGGGCRHAPRW